MANNDQAKQSPIAFSVLRGITLILLFVMLAVASIFTWPTFRGRFRSNNEPVTVLNPTFIKYTSTPTLLSSTPTASPTVGQLNSEISVVGSKSSLFNQGLIILSLDDNGYFHLLAYQQNGMPLMRLTTGDWHDITPATSPDGKRLAFASNRDGYWDLYILNLIDGAITRLTESQQYDGSPSWSPDGLWLAYESYDGGEVGGNLEIFVLPVDKSQDPIPLTRDPGADHSPAWSPRGREVAFVSTRSGDSEIWLADLDQVEGRFVNVSRNKNTQEMHPTWAPDGNSLSWASTSPEGLQTLQIWDLTRPNDRPKPLSNGDWSAWSPKGDSLLASLVTPNQTYLTGYSLQDSSLTMPILALPGEMAGMTWGTLFVPQSSSDLFHSIASVTPTPLWESAILEKVDAPNDRYEAVPLDGMVAPNPMLHDRVDESFQALRARVASEIGWDFLSTLEGAFVPLTSPLGPGMVEDWLYTGRAFRFNSAPIQAGWVVIVREDFGSQTFWRVFLRTRYQDGSQGMPLKFQPWNITARHSGDPWAYEEGGMLDEIPSGYWFDFTRLAAAYGWDRQPALSTWKLAYSASRFNEFVLREGLDWFDAMLEIYPRTALDTPTPVSSPTSTLTPTSTPTMSSTPTRIPWRSRTPTMTPTPRPTRTLRPTNTPWPTVTKIPTQTP